MFVCYRRADSGAAVEVLVERLRDRFGAGNVFRDVEDIPLGTDFRQALAGCDVFLLMIGPRWLDARDADGTRRLDRGDDPVRIEIETAIARGLLVVPVLVGGAAMPHRDRMPDGFEESEQPRRSRYSATRPSPAIRRLRLGRRPHPSARTAARTRGVTPAGPRVRATADAAQSEAHSLPPSSIARNIPCQKVEVALAQ